MRKINWQVLAAVLVFLFVGMDAWAVRDNIRREYTEKQTFEADVEFVVAPSLTLGVKSDTISEMTSGSGVTVDGVKLKDGDVYTDVIYEETAATGVTVDGVKLKDSAVYTDTITEKTAATGVTADGVLLKDGSVVCADGGTVEADAVNEATAATGVTVDGVLIKDGGVVLADGAVIEADTVNEATAATGVTVDGVLVKDGGAVFADGAVIEVDTVNEATDATGVTADGVLLKDGGIVCADAATLEVDTVNEATAATGVTIDGVLVKDGGVVLADAATLEVDTINEATAANGVSIDGVTLKDGVVTGSVTGAVTGAASTNTTQGNGLIVYLGNGLLQIGTLTISATPEQFKTTTTAYYRASGIQFNKTATDSLTFSAADTINVGTAAGDYYGIWLVQIDAAGTVSTKSPAADQVYASSALAIAALPAVDAGNVALGYIVVQAKTDLSWTANTDDMTAASDCAAVTFVDATVLALPASI